MREEIYTTYAPETDMTFILKDIYRKIDHPFSSEEIVSTTVVGWYFGRPDDDATEQFNGNLTANYD